LRWRVEQLTRDGDEYLLRRGDQVVRADRVVLATGPAMSPHVPSFAVRLHPRVVSLHAVRYRNPGQLREGPVLVVGAGNFGAEIALDLVRSHRVLLARRDTGRMPIAVVNRRRRRSGCSVPRQAHRSERVSAERLSRLATADGGRPSERAPASVISGDG
jgi:thioredoxin reductase